jgi:hypothetical protein
MRRRFLFGLSCLFFLGGGAMIETARTRADSFGFNGRLPVTKLEVAYLPASRTLKLRAILQGTPGSVEYQTTDAPTVDHLLRLVALRAQGVAVVAELENSELKALHAGIGGGASILAN